MDIKLSKDTKPLPFNLKDILLTKYNNAFSVIKVNEYCYGILGLASMDVVATRDSFKECVEHINDTYTVIEVIDHNRISMFLKEENNYHEN